MLANFEGAFNHGHKWRRLEKPLRCILRASIFICLILLLLLLHLPKNIYNFTIRHINNSLPTLKNMARWGLSQSPDCSFCLNPESLLHVVAGCQQYLDRVTWRHDSILKFIAKSLQPVINVHSSLYGFLNPSIITGENCRLDFLFLIQSSAYMF